MRVAWAGATGADLVFSVYARGVGGPRGNATEGDGRQKRRTRGKEVRERGGMVLYSIVGSECYAAAFDLVHTFKVAPP